MDQMLRAVVDIVKTQAGLRPMDGDEMAGMVRSLGGLTRKTESFFTPPSKVHEIDYHTAQRSIGKDAITCLECNRSFRVLTSKHILTHGLTREEYKDKYGLHGALICKSLAKARGDNMRGMQLWKRRGASGQGQISVD